MTPINSSSLSIGTVTRVRTPARSAKALTAWTEPSRYGSVIRQIVGKVHHLPGFRDAAKNASWVRTGGFTASRRAATYRLGEHWCSAAFNGRLPHPRRVRAKNAEFCANTKPNRASPASPETPAEARPANGVITCSTSAVAVCCSSASVSSVRCSARRAAGRSRWR